jgi:DNA-binding winged helix-turn-helix (wHTH) protein
VVVLVRGPAGSDSHPDLCGHRIGGNIPTPEHRSHRRLTGNSSDCARRSALRIRFGLFTLDLDTRQLTRKDCEIRLTPKAFDLLGTLAVDRPKVLSKRVLQERLWPDTFVAEANLSNLIAEIREALSDRARKPAFIRTAYGVGYAFCGDAVTLSTSGPRSDHAQCWLEWGNRRFPLSAGEHVIGRDPDAEVRVDASTVSRRHARLVVTAEGTVLEDLASKNGTFRGAARVTSPVRLANRDAIRIGSLLMTFHVRRPFGTTDTQIHAAS